MQQRVGRLQRERASGLGSVSERGAMAEGAERLDVVRTFRGGRHAPGRISDARVRRLSTAQFRDGRRTNRQPRRLLPRATARLSDPRREAGAAGSPSGTRPAGAAGSPSGTLPKRFRSPRRRRRISVEFFTTFLPAVYVTQQSRVQRRIRHKTGHSGTD